MFPIKKKMMTKLPPAHKAPGKAPGKAPAGLSKLPPQLAGKIGGLVAAKTPSGGAKAEALAAHHKAEAIIRKMK